LYAFLREAHNEGVKIITIENPVEYKLEGIVQTQVGDDYTFASGLRAILRQDPDIIMIGEVRDIEVAETAIHAAQTGHLVFTTLHTNSAAAGFPRLIDLGIDSRIFGTSLNIMLGQRLVRILCSECREQYPATTTERDVVVAGLQDHPFPPTLPEPLSLYKPKGCVACGGTGYKGRAGIFEAIIMDEAVEEAVIRDPREHIILEAARPQKIPSMLEDGLEKVLQGITSLEELSRVIELPQPDTLKKKTTTKETSIDDDFLAHVV
jgi:general secretion pathway protein E